MTTTVFYTDIDTSDGGPNEIEVIRHAQRLGYELVRFAGWSDADLGPSGTPGPRREMAEINRQRIREIVRTLTTIDADGYEIGPIINQVVPVPQRGPLEDEDGLRILRSIDPSLGNPDI